MQNATPEQIVYQVEALLERRRTGQARAVLKPALAEHPQHTGLLLQSAWTDYLDDQSADAMATVRQVLLVEPESESARLLHFELLREKQEYAEAERVILELLRDFPEHAHYYGRYAELMLKTLNVGKAHQLAREGLRYDPDDVACLTAQTICEFIERPDSTTSQGLQQLLVRHPQSVQTLVLIVVALSSRGENAEALGIAREMLRAQPDNEGLVELVQELRLATHWSMKPLWPLQRYGWGASLAIWIFAVVGLRALSHQNKPLAGAFSIVVVGYVIYSWFWPPILKRILRA